ncbi:UDP-glucose 4-epimerase GalE [Longibacter salinarum]|uniref:UDP-glucose 4-epimerase n=1 Tax=Longibacter salinarum TaxID=1850348 RepID=A0A2A8D292_9BACT|nr:UDP-glucose 4-epimerase GalE [Longibacter salinarum]PEN15092.1 UDP-glucose 4-epimerase GalE [Longibacter salinarum]
MSTLVTGGAGYIGSTVVRELIRQGEDVVVFDNLSQGHRKAVHQDATLVVGDLADAGAVDSVFRTYDIDAIMHFASHTLVGESMEEPFLYLDTNIRCGLNLMRAAVEHDADRFILSSTANLFGLPDEMPITEETSIDPGSPYGESKRILERYLHWLDRTRGMTFAALRYFNAAGAAGPDHGEDHDPETHLIPIVLEVALGQRDEIVIFGDDYDTPDGTCVRDYIHVRDLAQAHILALRALKDGKSRVYNLGNGNGYSVREVIETAREVTGREIPARVGDRRPGDPATLIADAQRIRDELGWDPQFPTLSDIISTAWDWHVKHPDGYASVSERPS